MARRESSMLRVKSSNILEDMFIIGVGLGIGWALEMYEIKHSVFRWGMWFYNSIGVYL